MGTWLNKGIGTLFDQEFFVSVVFDFETNCLVYDFDGFSDLLFKGFSFDVGANGQMRMADPNIQGSLVQILSNFKSLVTGYIVLQCVKLFSTVGSRSEENNTIIPSVS